MAVTLEVKSNQKQLSNKLKKFQSVLPRVIDKGIKQAGFQLLEIIRTKTKKGIDFNDKPFAPYTQGYINHLQKIGYPTKVDLHYSGDMMGSLTPNQAIKKTGKHKISLGFARAEERNKALFNQVLMGDKNRKFFGFNDRTKNIIQKTFNRFVEKELRKFRIWA